MEFGTLLIYVVLINLISDDHDVLLVANIDDLLNVFLRENLTSGVTWVDHYDAPKLDVVLKGSSYLLLYILNIERPVL